MLVYKLYRFYTVGLFHLSTHFYRVPDLWLTGLIFRGYFGLTLLRADHSNWRPDNLIRDHPAFF
jgi:hypothetical protein